MKVSHDFKGRQATLSFDGKPSEAVRSCLKANGFRWSPSGSYWWRSRITGAADVLDSVRRIIDRESGVKLPDAPCWLCKDPNGYFRNRGAATPVWCDACDKKAREDDERRRIAADDFDLANNRSL